MLLTVIAVAAGMPAAWPRNAPIPAFPPVAIEDLGLMLDIAVDIGTPSGIVLATRSGVYRAGLHGFAVRVSLSDNVFWSVVTHPRQPSILYGRGIDAEGRNLGLIVSRDAGHTWRALAAGDAAPPLVRGVAVSGPDPNVLHALSNKLWLSWDGGATWIEGGDAPDWPVYDIAASSLDPARFYVAAYGGLYETTDGGRTWAAPLPGLRRQPVTSIDTGPDGALYAFSTYHGLVKADERTGAWVTLNGGFGGCIIQHLAVDPRDGNRLYAVVRCNRVLLSNDGGVSWSAYGSQGTVTPDCVSDPRNVSLIPAL